MDTEHETFSLVLKGTNVMRGGVPIVDIGNLLHAVHGLNRLSYSVIATGRPAHGRLDTSARKLSTITFAGIREGSIIIDLIVPLLAHQYNVFGDTPIISVMKVWVESVKYVIRVLGDLKGETRDGAQIIEQHIHIQNNIAPIIQQVSYNGHNHIKELVRPISPDSINEIELKSLSYPDLPPVVLGPEERDMVLASHVFTGGEETLVGVLIRFDIQRLTGIVVTPDGQRINCEFVYKGAEELKHDMAVTLAFHGRPQYMDSMGKQFLSRFVVLGAARVS